MKKKAKDLGYKLNEYRLYKIILLFKKIKYEIFKTS
jgi:hypothetical protein